MARRANWVTTYLTRRLRVDLLGVLLIENSDRDFGWQFFREERAGLLHIEFDNNNIQLLYA